MNEKILHQQQLWKVDDFLPFPMQFRFKQSLHLGNTDFTEQEVSLTIDHIYDADDDNQTIPSVGL